MQELKIYRWCDHCHTEGGKLVEATERWHLVIELPDGRAAHPRSLDLCEPHAKPVRELRDLLVKAGAKLSPKGKAPQATEPVPLPEVRRADRLPDNFPRGVTQPPPKVEVKPALSEGKRACPICDKVLTRSQVLIHVYEVHGGKRIKQPRKCPDCGKHLDRPHSMVLHRAASHAYDYQAEVVATIKPRS